MASRYIEASNAPRYATRPFPESVFIPAELSAQTNQPFTIDAVLSAPYSSNLTGVENRVVWVVTEKGARTIWTATFLNPKPRQLTKQLIDDGQDLGELTLSPDGRWVAYVRGGGKNKEGVSPNPTSNPVGAEQVIFVAKTDDLTTPVRVGAGSRPVWSPEGARLLFGCGGQLYMATLNDVIKPKPRKAPTKLFTARGSQVDYSFSPDGQRILFASYRGYHNLVGVYSIDNQQISWIAAGVDWDQFPVWSPDGRFIAFSSDRDGGKAKICIMGADGSAPHCITDLPGECSSPSWEPLK